MDEFRKPYEYTEEKRGFLLVFIIMILTIDSFLVVAYTIQSFNALKHIPVLRIATVAIGSLMALFTLITVILCYRLNKNLVPISKIYLIVRTVFIMLGIMIVYFYNIDNEALIGPGPNQYASASELTALMLVLPIAFTLAFSISWYLYFLKSKRVKALQKEHTGT